MSVGIFQNGEYNKVAGNAKDSTAANTTYNNGTSGLQANNVQSAIDEVSAKIGQENISQVGNSVTGAINNLNSNFGKINHIKTIDFVNGISFKWTVAGLQPIIDSSEQLPLLKNITNSNGYIKSITLDYSSNWQLKIIITVDGIDYEKYISLS